MENGIIPPEKYQEWSKTRIEYELENLEIILDNLILDSDDKPTVKILQTMVQIEQLEQLLKEKDL